MGFDILPGQSFPLGATIVDSGVNFCVYAKEAKAIELLLFDESDAPQPSQTIFFDPIDNKTSHYWHVFIPQLKAGQVYAYRAYGEFAPKKGLRFDGKKVLLDPYAKAVVGWRNYDREAAIAPGDNCDRALRSVVVDSQAYDWEDDVHPKIPYGETVIYELHVGGFTSHPNSGLPPEKRGTFAGLIEKIPYLKELGITAVELMPIHQFDENDARPGLKNYWGYSTMAFFAPHQGYSYRRDRLGSVDEFRDLVKALHRAGIEVILDVVFNHTAEGDHQGPTLSFKGLSNDEYYMLDEKPAFYRNYSGCGNTFETNAIATHLILDCLHYWVADMHVDGFRFDLASALSRNSLGVPLETPPLLWAIDSDPVLAGTKIIAEAWDAGGLYQVGKFAGERFSEWNGPFRDDVRRFIKSDANMTLVLADRLMGSPDIYHHRERGTHYSINFVTCHDGFTLNDLVSYNQKHNEANGEESRDGGNDNCSWNCGVEGETDDREIEALRLRQMKNLLTVLFMSQGTPMLLMGDEVRRSQLGNNNAYCQNNELSWFDWSAIEKQQEFLRFFKGAIAFSQSLKIFRYEKFLEIVEDHPEPYLVWHGVELEKPDWSYESRSLALTLRYPEHDELIHIMLNAYWKPLSFALPPLSKNICWHRIIDTSLPSPQDFCEPELALKIEEKSYQVEERSTVVLMGN
jgi:isoamylase